MKKAKRVARMARLLVNFYYISGDMYISRDSAKLLDDLNRHERAIVRYIIYINHHMRLGNIDTRVFHPLL